MARVFISLGSNMGDRLSNIQQAVSSLSMHSQINIVKTSSFYETEPWGNKNQDWFLNAALALDTDMSCKELLEYCQNIEVQLGRVRNQKEKWSQRAIDIDILMYDDKIIPLGDELTVPHPLMHLRAFVLVPMLEVKADLVHPVFKKTISELYDELENPEDVFLYGTVLPR
ncbi:MAG: 2-amino-4-hydroxy-6-hydroxymethyldihydropteridine diphosphokinase [Candidatus Gastranaerophilales bacterium]|jgi:2-amino-4-hydroxy-6-hydroxymethyldihydropteridine diphosphokinase|nr:2-amino-4-hydroxy-6-hydroxymethyldihydropteridine diphosphokinase [Candidatus Gastranaerophilales bacterium]